MNQNFEHVPTPALAPSRQRKPLPETLTRGGFSPWEGYQRGPAAGQAALRAATLFGDRFEQPDGSILFLVTVRAGLRLERSLGLPAEQIWRDLQGTFVLATRSGKVLDSGRRLRLAPAGKG